MQFNTSYSRNEKKKRKNEINLIHLTQRQGPFSVSYVAENVRP